jgi:archaellum component FlaC
MLALTDKIESGIRYADYGYSSWGSKEKIGNKNLDRMYEFDAVVIDDIGAINDVVEEFTDKMNQGKFDDAWDYTYRMWQIVQRLEEKWKQRDSFLKGYQE